MSTVTFLQKYRILNKIGEGSFSEVLKCQDLKMGSFLAAKRLKKKFKSWEEVNECAEVVAMHKLPNHSNILHMSAIYFDSCTGTVTFLFELMDMSLCDFINMRRKKHVHESRAKYYLYQILSGLNHLHRNGMFHRDIKPENILLKVPSVDEQSETSKYAIIKIADLGSLRGIYSKPPFTEYISTRWYRSPECLLTSGYYGCKMDIWATGCVFYELLTCKPLFAGSNEVDQLARIHKILGTPSKRTLAKFATNKSCNYEYFPQQVGKGLGSLLPNISPDAQSILKLMITYDPEKRCNVRRLLDHKYFKNIRESESYIYGKRSTSDKPVGDFKASSFSSSKSQAQSLQFLSKPEKRIKRSYNEMQNISKNPSTPKEKTRKEKAEKRLQNTSLESVAPKKFKASESCKNLVNEIVEREDSFNVKLPKKLKIEHKKLEPLPFQSVSKPTVDAREPKGILCPKRGKQLQITSCNEKTEKQTSPFRKSVKVKKDSGDNYRNTTGNIPQIFSSKIPEKITVSPVSKSFVEKKTTKYSDLNLNSGNNIKPSKLPKMYFVDPVKNIKKNRNV